MFSIDFTGDMTSSAGIQIDDRDFGSLFDEKLADVLADISASPGNDSDLVLESHIVLQTTCFPLHSRWPTKVPDRRIEPLLTPRYRPRTCLLYTSDAADERSSVDLGGRRIIKKK